MFELSLSPMLYLHLGLDLICVSILTMGIYRIFRPGGGATFTLVMLNIVTFCLTTLLSSVSIDLGVSLGLFAIFGILRYRTSPLDIGDLTYVFIVIGLAVINGISIESVSIVDVIILNALVLGSSGLLEMAQRQNGIETIRLRYDRLDFLAPARRGELLEDLSERLGVPCKKVTIRSVNLLMSTAELYVEFESDENTGAMFTSNERSSFSEMPIAVQES